MHNNVVARPPGVGEVETAARADLPAQDPPTTDMPGQAPSAPAGRSVAAELGKMFYWLAVR
jgi:hypothetical protein